VAIAGAFVSIDAAGHLSIDRGYVREEDEPSEDDQTLDTDEGEGSAAAIPAPSPEDSPRIRTAIITIGGGPVEPAPEQAEDVEPERPLSDTLVMELTAVRTVALQNAVANNPHVAMTVLLHKLCRASRTRGYVTSCLEASVVETMFVVQNPELKHTPAALAMAERRDAWKARLPEDEAALWEYLTALDDGARADLLAHLISLGVTAVDERPKYDNGRTSPDTMRRRIVSADRVARAVGLDMVAEAWQPTSDNYLSRVTKTRILDAVREAKGEHTALIAHLKKGDMAREAERLLSGSGWLPELLRHHPIDLPAAPVGQDEEALPDFLDGAGTEPVEDLAAGDNEFLVAAE
jgi:ParB family chromosome partitioning protein